MKTAFQIFRRDVRRLLKNRAATLVMIGVCLLPSLYAWFNIAANIIRMQILRESRWQLPIAIQDQNRRDHDECRRFDC